MPDHSTFSKNRYGRFRESDVYRVLFEEVVEQCRQAGIVPGEGFAVDGSFVHGDARRDRRVHTVESIREGDTLARPVREYLQAHDAGNPAHEGGAKYLSPTDPAAAWNTKEGRGKFGYFNNYLVDTDHLRKQGHHPAPGDLAHLSPRGWEHINLTGDYYWDTSPTLGPDQFRPLRTLAHDFAAAA